MKKRQEKTQNGFPLGYLVYNQRRNKNSLSQDKIDRLNKLNFVWNPNEEDWEELKSWYDDNPNSEDWPDLQYPVDIILEDGTTTTINSDEEMDSIKLSCK